MSTGLPPDFDPDDPTEIGEGRRFPFHVVGHWVMLAIDPKTGKILHPAARTLYSILKMHANRDTAEAKPSTETLAELMGVSRGDKVTPYLQALVRVGAIDIDVRRTGVNRMRKRNFYTVHESPPPGYTGYLSLAEYYAVRKGKTAGQSGPPEKGGSGPGATSDDTTPEPPKRGGPETPKTGAPDNPKTGGPDTPKRGQELDQPRTTSSKNNYGEEEAARARGSESGHEGNEQAPELPAPSHFALVSIRQIIADAPQTKGAGKDELPELIGDTEVDELARMFDAETERLAEHRSGAGGDLMLWLRRGLSTADSLLAVLRFRLRPGHATSKIVRPKKPAAPSDSSGNGSPREDVPQMCATHPDERAGDCQPCAEAEAAYRAKQAEKSRQSASRARQIFEETKARTEAERAAASSSV